MGFKKHLDVVRVTEDDLAFRWNFNCSMSWELSKIAIPKSPLAFRVSLVRIITFRTRYSFKQIIAPHNPPPYPTILHFTGVGNQMEYKDFVDMPNHSTWKNSPWPKSSITKQTLVNGLLFLTKSSCWPFTLRITTPTDKEDPDDIAETQEIKTKSPTKKIALRNS